MTTFKITTDLSPNEIVPASHYEIEDGWVHFYGEGDVIIPQVASYPAGAIVSIRRNVEPDLVVSNNDPNMTMTITASHQMLADPKKFAEKLSAKIAKFGI